MIAAESLISESLRQASVRNGEVFELVFNRLKLSCPKCNYSLISEHWQSLWKKYSALKRDIHRLKTNLHFQSYLETQEAVDAVKNSFYQPIWNRCPASDCGAILSLRRQSYEIREEMRKYEPCEDCRKRYNPTCRKYSFLAQGNNK